MRLLLALVLLLAAPAAASAATATPPGEVAVAEAGEAATVEVTLDEPAAGTVRIPWRTASAARYIADAPIANAGAEYTARSGTLQFAPGATRAELSVPVADDAVDDPSPYFAVEFHDPEGADLARTFSLVRIDDDDPTPPASVADIAVTEGDGSALVPVTRAAISRRGHAAYVVTPVAGSALAGEDFGGTVRMSIGYGMRSAVARIPIADDRRHEETESFTVQLAPDTGPLPSFSSFFPGPVGTPAVATVTIADDDPVAGPPTIVTVRRVSGTVKLRGKRLRSPARALKRHKVDARRGSARLVVTRGGTTLRSAVITRGAVRVLSTTRLALTSRRVTIRSTGMSLRGDEVTTAPATGTARWTVEEVRRGTRVKVRSGRVEAGGRTLRAGRQRTFG